MATTTTSDPHGHHDWHSAEYVDEWIASDATHDATRRPLLRRLAEMLPFERDAALRVIDVGGGYGELSRAVLETFPNCRVVLHDFSEPMIAQAQQRLEDLVDRLEFVRADLRDPGWTNALPDGVDAVVSSIAIHNVRDPARMRAIYAEIAPLVGPGGCFFDIDFMSPAGPRAGRAFGARSVPADGAAALLSVEGHLAWLRDAGFDEADVLLREGIQAAVGGFRSAG